MIGVHHRFTPLQRLLHWLMAVCILAMIFIGVGMVSTTMPKYLPLVAIHKSLGIVILALAAHLSHYALYALMIGMPLLGWAMLSATAYPVVVFGGLWLPATLPQSDTLHTWLWGAHFYLAFAFFALVLMHVAAALFHALIRRDGVFDAMAPVSIHNKLVPAE